MSKYMVFEFYCDNCENMFDGFVKPDKHQLACPECKGMAHRVISSPRLDPKMGVDPAFSTMADRWDKTHRQGRKVDEKRAEEHGPDSWGADGADVRR
jgi:putative FmdB family regulatory protein